ncbi:MAG: exodeoxyribonuclease V subunit gamma [Leptospiraceae bacterium]|nr:exodeoxyribonuclease V subunit gamma [Leptospiraceae bacterium]MDW7974926.1 exodeoxyribonuclease V subunit gamma [Leptospiraceae bacterium]
MLKIYTANKIEVLFEQFLKDLKKTQEKKDDVAIYEPYVVLVPNRNVEYWLRQKIAEETNICMNFSFFPFEEGVWQILQANDLLPNKDLQRIEPDFLSLLIYQIIEENPDKLEYFKTFAEHHKDYPGNIYDLSYYLADIFYRYHYHNPDLIKYFKENNNETPNIPESKKSYFKEQKWIYQQIREKIKNENRLFLFDVIEELENRVSSQESKEKKSIFAFGIQNTNYFYARSMGVLKKYFDIYHYQVILYKPQTTEASEKTHQVLFSDIPQRISYYTIQLLKHYAEEEEFLKESEESSQSPQKKTLLNKIQEEFIEQGIENTLKNTTFNDFEEKDPSIQIIGAPDKKIEIKAVIEDIQKQVLEKNKDFKLNDVAILSPVLEEYYPILKGLLEYLDIPYNIQDPKLMEISYFAKGVLAILDIIDSYSQNKTYLSREQVVKLLENPIFQKNHHFTYEDILVFYSWINNLGIYFEDSNEPYHSWSLALKRLRIGKFTNHELSIQNNSSSNLSEFHVIPYWDSEAKLENLEKLHVLIQFFEDVEKLAKKIHEKEENSFYQEFDDLILKHLNVHYFDDIYSLEKKAYSEFRKKLYYLKATKIQPKSNFLKSYFKIAFSRINGKINEYLFQGITISSLLPSRPIPFKRIYILGLNQENFPGKDFRASFDLIEELLDEENYFNSILKENILSKSKQNLVLFYETLQSSREALILSYVNYNLQEKKERFPSYIIADFKEFLNKIKPSPYIKIISHGIKLKENNIINHRFEFFTSILARERNSLDKLSKSPIWNELKKIKYLAEIDENSKKIEEIYKSKKFADFKPITFQEQNQKNIININKLFEFLKIPMKYHLEKYELLRKQEDEEIDENAIYEFELNKKIKIDIIKKVIMEFILTNSDLDSIIDFIFSDFHKKGFLPVSFDQVAMNSVKEDIKNLISSNENQSRKSKSQASSTSENVLAFLKNTNNKYYVNKIYVNPHVSEISELKLSPDSMVLEFPTLEIKINNTKYLFEGSMNTDIIVITDPNYVVKEIYMFKFLTSTYKDSIFFDSERFFLNFLNLITNTKNITFDCKLIEVNISKNKKIQHNNCFQQIIEKQFSESQLESFIQDKRQLFEIYEYNDEENNDYFTPLELNLKVFEDLWELEKFPLLKLFFEEVYLLKLNKTQEAQN